MTQKFFGVVNLSDISNYEEDVYKLSKSMSTVYNIPDTARAVAIQQAGKSPGTQFAVMEVVEVYEALAPTVIEKKFNSDGELLNVGQDQATL